MATLTLAELRTAARQEADKENDFHVSEAELTRYINVAIAELYDMLVSAYGNEYFTKQGTPFQTNNGNTYPLPADFYKMTGVDVNYSPGNKPIALKPIPFHERNFYRVPGPRIPYQLKYMIVGNDIVLVPNPNSGYTITLWYIPKCTYLVNDNDTFNGYNGWEEYVIVWAAIKMLAKEESETSELHGQLEMLKRRINMMAENRDAGEVAKITDVTPINEWGYFQQWP